jgi:hypothetical protein
MRKIMDLEDGEALLFAPRGIVTEKSEHESAETWSTAGGKEIEDVDVKEELVRLSDRYLKIKMRKRVTADGGQSIMATSNII